MGRLHQSLLATVLLAAAVGEIPPAQAQDTAVPEGVELGSERVVYVTAEGDTIDSVAMKYALLPRDLLSWNGVDDGQALAPGTELVIWVAPLEAPEPEPEPEPAPVEKKKRERRPATAQGTAPWTPLSRWDGVHGVSEPLQLRASLGFGAVTNHYHLSADEQTVHATAATGALLSGRFADYPTAAIAGPLLRPAIEAAVTVDLAGGLTRAHFSWKPDMPLAAWPAQSHPMEIGLQRVLTDGTRGFPRTWASVAWIGNPYDYDRPLRVKDGYLANPLPDQFVTGVARVNGVELFAGITPIDWLVLAPVYRVERHNYPDELANWDTSTHDVGLRTQLLLAADRLRLEVHGGFASSYARGDHPGTALREPDPSWTGSRWRLETAWDRTADRDEPYYTTVYGELLYRSYRTGDQTDRVHHLRQDIGGVVGLEAGCAPDLGLEGLGFGLSYEVGFNHTNLPLALRADDENDFVDHRILLRADFRKGLDLF